MSEKKVFLIMDKQEEKHDQPWPSYHIETPKRLDVIYERLQTTGLYSDTRIEHLPRREATYEEIQAVHTKRYIDAVKRTEKMNVEQQEEFCTRYEDIYVNSATWKRAKLAAGSAIDLVTAVSINKLPGIAFIRPPGHHAMPDEGCGFCIFNNVAIAAKEALRSGLAKKVIIVDYDVHAANGTQECIEEMGENIRLISIHRYENGTFWPNMPQTGIYHNYKNTINLPLNTTGLTDSDYFALFTHLILPFIHGFKPDLIIVSSGFDASLGDPEGYMNVTPAGFATMMRLLMNTGTPVAAILEGGYFLEALAADSEWVLRALLGDHIPKIKLGSINESVLDTISRIFAKYENSTCFFRKVQELRRLMGKNSAESIEDLTDYKGERTVNPPYNTRGIYTPFTEEKIDAFKQRLLWLLQSYQTIDEPFEGVPQLFEKKSGVIDNLLSVEDGKLSFGSGKAVKIFVELIFISSFNPLIMLESFPNVEDDEFDSIRFIGFDNIKDIDVFHDLPILNL